MVQGCPDHSGENEVWWLFPVPLFLLEISWSGLSVGAQSPLLEFFYDR